MIIYNITFETYKSELFILVIIFVILKDLFTAIFSSTNCNLANLQLGEAAVQRICKSAIQHQIQNQNSKSDSESDSKSENKS